MFFTFYVNLPFQLIEEHLKTSINSEVIHIIQEKLEILTFLRISFSKIDQNYSFLSCFIHNFEVFYVIFREKL